MDEALLRHPEVSVLALRARDPATNELVIMGSTFGRHGKRADADDLKVLESPKPITGVYSAGRRFGVDLPLHDKAGVPIGTLNVGYAYRTGDDQKPLVSQALALRDELQSRIDPPSTLSEIDP